MPFSFKIIISPYNAVFLCSLIKRNVSLPDQLELKTDEDRKRKVTEVVEKMSDEQTFGNRLVLMCGFVCLCFFSLTKSFFLFVCLFYSSCRVQYRINYIRDPYRVLIYLKK